MATYVGTLGDDTHAGLETVMYGLDGNDTLQYNGFSVTAANGVVLAEWATTSSRAKPICGAMSATIP